MSRANYRRVARRIVLTTVVGLIAILAATVAQAQTNIVVDNTADDTAAGHCSLREGINSATGVSGTGTCATGSGPFTITFDPSLAGQTIGLTSTLPTITNGTTLTITGPTSSPSGITIDGRNAVQLMQVVPSTLGNLSATVNLQNLTLANGNSVGSLGLLTGPPTAITSGLGGAIYNQGTLNVSNCTFSNNRATGLSLQPPFTGNINLPPDGTDGNEVAGGAIFNTRPGTLTVSNSTFLANQATGGSFPGATGLPPNANTSFSGRGGAIWNSWVLTVTNSTFSGNQAVGGAAAAMFPATTGGGSGGAIQDLGAGATTTITGCTFSGNQAVGGSVSISSVTPVVAGPALGGAIFESGFMMTLSKSTFTNNQATGGNSTVSGASGAFVGGVALGGALVYAHSSSPPTVSNCTFSGNQVTGGTDLNDVETPSDGSAIFTLSSTVDVTNCTLSGNESETSMSGATATDSGLLLLKGSIVAGNTPNNCGRVGFPQAIFDLFGNLFHPSYPSDFGYNISSDGTCGFAKSGTANNGINVDPMLSPLASNGGPTLTFALQEGSPAIDAIPAPDDPNSPDCTKHTSPSSPPCVNQCTFINTSDPLMTDQRGFPRPDRGEVCCDIGAYEFQETFPGQPGTSTCHGDSVSTLATQYGGMDKAATALCFPSVQALQDAIKAFCGG